MIGHHSRSEMNLCISSRSGGAGIYWAFKGSDIAQHFISHDYTFNRIDELGMCRRGSELVCLNSVIFDSRIESKIQSLGRILGMP